MLIPVRRPPQIVYPIVGQLHHEGGSGTLLGRVHTYANGSAWTEHWVTPNVATLMGTTPLRISYNSADPTNGMTWTNTVGWYQGQNFSGKDAALDCTYNDIANGTPGSSGPNGTTWKVYRGTSWANRVHQGTMLRSVDGSGNYHELWILYSGYVSLNTTNNLWFEQGSSSTRSAFLSAEQNNWAGGQWVEVDYAWANFP